MFKKIFAFVQFILVSAVMGALVAGLVLPPVLGLFKGAEVGYDVWKHEMPSDISLKPLMQKSKMTDSEGNVIAQFYSENRVIVKSKNIAPIMKKAIVSIEDERFYSHGAIDFKGTMRALVKNTTSDSVQGGSTITQQYVKNILFNNAQTKEEREAATEQTMARKLKELRYAQALEEEKSKDEILTGYLNIVNFGDGAYGIEAASRHYFGVSAKKLTVPQAALIAGLVQNPSALNPVHHPSDARKKRNVVLAKMAENEFISQEDKVKFQKQDLNLDIHKVPNGCTYSDYPFYCQKVINIMLGNPVFGETQEDRERNLYSGITITTALDTHVQKSVDKTAREALGTDNQYAAGVAVVEPGTGKVKGIGSNREFGSDEHQTQVILADKKYQIGSTFKPITLLAALENGWGMDKKMASPARWCASRPNDGCFTNLGGAEYGHINGKQALAYSANTYFTNLSQKIGTKKVQNMAERLGMDLPDDLTGFETSTTLGVFDSSPVEVANIYATIAADGVYCDPTWITQVKNSKGKKMKIPQADCHQEISKSTAREVRKGLVGVIDGNISGRTGRDMSLGRPAFGKTGTTDNYSAVWFAGAVPQYSMAVWVGDPRGGYQYPLRDLYLYGNRVNSVYGSTASGPIWKNSFQRILKDVPRKSF